MAKILVVEDEPDLRMTIVEELNDEGHITIEAGNGVEGLEQLATDTPDLIISDITMPEMNGYQFLRSVKEKHPEHAQTPFIFLSALADRNNELKGLRLGVDDYLTKPVDFDLLIARIDLAMRRRPAQTAAPQTSDNEAPDNASQGDEASVDKLGAILQGNDGRVLTGKFETVSLDTLRQKLGDRWSETSDQIVKIVEAVIREYVGPEDTVRVTPSKDFIVCFADPSQEQVDAKVGLIRDAIWDRLFSQIGDEDLSRVDAQAFELSLNVDGKDDVDAVFAGINDAVDQQKAQASKANQKSLSQLYQYENLYALSLLTSKGAQTKIKLLSFEKKFNDRIKKLHGSSQFSGAFLLELEQVLFERLKAKQTFKDAFNEAAMLLPIPFELTSDQEARDGLTRLCKDLESSMGVTLIIEVTEGPDRIKSHMGSLTPLPIGRQVQFLEIRRAAQMSGVDPAELSKLGIAFVSMSFDAVMQHKEQGLRQFVQSLKSKDVKFFVKEVPEGKLMEAQSCQAQLYAIRR